MIAALEILKRAWPYLVAVAIVLGALFGAYRHGVTATTDRYERQLATERAASASALAAEQAKSRKAEQAAAARIAAIDAQRTKELHDAQAAADRVITDLRADVVRVRDRFACPAPAHGGEAAHTSGTGLGNAATRGGLSAADVEFLLREAKRADEVTKQLQAAQDIIRAHEAAP